MEKNREKSLDSKITVELLYLIQRFLTITPCRQSAEVLKTELEKLNVLPKRIDYLGNCHKRSFESFEREVGAYLPKDLLLGACHQASALLQEKIPQALPSLRKSFLGVGRQSLSRASYVAPKWALAKSQAQLHNAPLQAPHDIQNPPALFGRIRGREYTGRITPKNVFQKSFVQSIHRSSTRILGHLASVFCVTFDVSGNYIFTGADDNLVKVWSAREGRLLFTFRGSAGEITDLTVSHENSLIAAGSVDKIIRVWSLRNGSPVAVLSSHTAMITSIQFLPYVDGENRYMISTANDCSVCFWKWNSVSQEFVPNPIKCSERTKVGAQMICSCYSPGGHFVATGCTDHCVRIYRVDPDGPLKILEQEAHSDRVDSLEWAHDGLRFVSGSKDGTAKIWKFERQVWSNLLLKVADSDSTKGQPEPASQGQSGSRHKPNTLKVTMVAWSGDDTFVITASSDFLLRIWDSVTGSFVRYLKGHTDESYVLEPHPVNPWLLLSASHDGCLMLWDLVDGVCVKQKTNKFEGRGHGAFFDCHFSPDGTYAAAVDSYGCLTIITQESNESLKKVPEEQFFLTDYRPLVRDANGYVMDENTQTVPHLMAPPDLVMADGGAYPAEFQRLVPGREKSSKGHLERIQVRRTDETEGVDVEDSTEEDVAPPSDNPVPSSSDNGINPSCVWLKRSIVRPLSVGDLEKSAAKREALGAFETELYEKEMHKAPLAVRESSAPPCGEDGHSNGRFLRRRRELKAAHNYRTRRNPRPSEAVSSEDFVDPDSVREDGSPRNSGSSGIESDDESSSSSESQTSDTNYSGEDAGPSTSGASKSRVRRTRLRVRKGEAEEVSDHSDIDEEMHELREERRRRSPPSEEPRTSVSPQRRMSPKLERRPLKRSQRKRLVRVRNSNSSGDQAESTPEYMTFFPEWLTAVKPRKFPYFPQVGDEVVYFRQGHEVYLDLVLKRKLYEPSKKMRTKSDLDAEEFAIVDQVKYELIPYRLCNLKLSQINAKTGGRTGLSYHVRYHDMNDVVDFIILRNIYSLSLHHRWKPGDRFQSVIDESWWFGTVEKKEPYSEQFPRSHYQCLKVKWDNGEDEQMSPWDLEPLNSTLCTGKNARCIPVEEEELLALAQFPETGRDWSDGRDKEDRNSRIVHAIDSLATGDGVEMFLQPVSLQLYPEYSSIIAYPVDLGTVKSRLKMGFYRHQAALEFDLRQMALNAKQFNESNSPICRQAIMLHEALLRFIRNPEEEDIFSIYHSLDLASTEDLNRNLMAKETSFSSAKEKKRARISSESGTISTETWHSECRHVLEQILASDDSSPFRNSDDSPEISDIFDNSFNLTQISERLEHGEYGSPEEFQTDINNLLQNCRSVATNKRSPVFKKALRLHSLFLDKINPVMDKWKRAQEISLSKAYRKSRKKTRSHEYNTRAQRSRPVPQARPTLTYLNHKKSEDRRNGSWNKRKEPEESLIRKRPATRRIPEFLESSRSENGHSDPSDIYNSYSEEEERQSSTRCQKRRTEQKLGQSLSRTRFGGKRVVRYAESSDDEWGETENSEDASVVLSQSSRGRIRKLRRYDFQ